MRYDIAIVGGGLAGLTASIHLRKLGYRVVVFEKSTYPKHKVCGEYISNEVKPYLVSLGLEDILMQTVDINSFQFTAHANVAAETPLEMGGFGISRYKLDLELYQFAVNLGVDFRQKSVESIVFDNDEFTIEHEVQAKICLGAFGKRSILDKKLKRFFANKRTPWVAYKAHFKGEISEDLVSLHHFDGGYCGISRVENGHINLCYLVHDRVFKEYKNFDDLQKNVLEKNKALADFYRSHEMVFERPLSISQIYFGSRNQVDEHVLMIGDSGGMIHPLAGNGMAMAFHSAKIVAELVDEFFGAGNFDRQALERDYERRWKAEFTFRIRIGSVIQSLLLRTKLTNFIIGIKPLVRFMLPRIVKFTHGAPLKPAKFT